MKNIIIVFLFLLSCSSPKPEILSKEEYIEFGSTVAKQLEYGHINTILDKFQTANVYHDLMAYIDTLGHQNKVSKTKRKSYPIELEDAAKSLINSLHYIAQSGQSSCDHFYLSGDEPHVILSISSQRGIDMIDLTLLTINKKTKIINIESFNTGTNLADEFLTQSLSKLEYGWRGGPYIQALEEIRNANDFLGRGQPNRAWNALSRIEPDFFFQSSFQATKVRVASQLSDTLYLNQLSDWIGMNWDYAGFRHWKSAEYYALIGDTISTQQSLDSLESIVGSNLVLTQLRNNLQ